MARFDVYRDRHGPGLMLDCQANIISSILTTRFVVPLLPPDMSPKPAGRLNPLFEIDERPYIMVTQFAAAVPARDLGEPVASLIDQDTAIIGAIDMLLSGY